MNALHHLLELSAERRPEAEAVVDRSRYLSYAQLEAGANRVARTLLDVGVLRGDRVGVYLDKSVDAVAAIYGIMKAGAVYVPLDPAAPVARLGFIAADCGMRVLVSGRGKSGRWPGLVEAGAPLATVVSVEGAVDSPPSGVDVLDAGDVGAASDSRPTVEVLGQDLAYILYTSGSTGEPKGVMLTHRNALTFVEWATRAIGVGPDDRLSSHAPFHFDLSVFDLYASARAGAAVVLVPPEASILPRELAKFIQEAGITVWYSVPSILTALSLRGGLKGGDLPQLRAVVFAGEVFPTRFLRRLMGLLPRAKFHNWYGPTETNVCTAYRVTPIPEGRDDPIPIGRPIADTRVYVVTEAGSLAARGQPGELYVQGGSVMRGYWGDQERTARTLVPSPLGESAGLAYRTGDMGKEMKDGNLRFLGRRDAQVKSRGYRIELGEVEAAILSHSQAVECAVLAVPDDEVGSRLVAHVVGGTALTEEGIKRHCLARLPKYMIPEAFIFQEALPRTSTGKIDRQALTRG